jgi:hypothetical protein
MPILQIIINCFPSLTMKRCGKLAATVDKKLKVALIRKGLPKIRQSSYPLFSKIQTSESDLKLV